MATKTMLPNPTEARQYFEDKMQFTTGPVELERMMKEEGKDLVILDVRAADDYAEGHVPGAINLPKEKWGTLAGLRKNARNVVYCYSLTCHLAATACLEFAEKGFPVMELDGGFEVWSQKDFPVER